MGRTGPMGSDVFDQVNPQELDRHFDSWLPFASEASGLKLLEEGFLQPGVVGSDTINFFLQLIIYIDSYDFSLYYIISLYKYIYIVYVTFTGTIIILLLYI